MVITAAKDNWRPCARAGGSFALGPTLELFDLESDPRESKPVRDPALQSKLRGLAVMFQEEMSRRT